MNFGYFDEENREYVITKPNTRLRGVTILARRSMAQSFQTTQVDTAS